MILAEKIIKHRKQNGWSQEELAMKLNISRQSVSKWESGASIPDLDKIIRLSQIFEVSTDYLLKDELEEEPVQVPSFTNGSDTVYEPNPYGAEELPTTAVSVEEADTYMNLVEKISRKIAAGVTVCILSPILLIVLGAMAEYQVLPISEDMAGGIGVSILLLMVAGAVSVFIMQGMKLNKYEYLEKNYLSLQYGVAGIAEKKKEEFEPTFKKCIATGVAMCITSVVPLMIAAAFQAPEVVFSYCIGILLALVAFAVYLFVWAGMIFGSYQKLLEEGDYTREKKLENHKIGNLATVYWCTIAAVYVGYSLTTRNWDTSWIIWPCAGILFAAVCGLAAMLRKK